MHCVTILGDTTTGGAISDIIFFSIADELNRPVPVGAILQNYILLLVAQQFVSEMSGTKSVFNFV